MHEACCIFQPFDTLMNIIITQILKSEKSPFACLQTLIRSPSNKLRIVKADGTSLVWLEIYLYKGKKITIYVMCNKI